MSEKRRLRRREGVGERWSGISLLVCRMLAIPASTDEDAF